MLPGILLIVLVIEGAHKVFRDSKVAIVLFEIVVFFCSPFYNRERELGM